MDYMKRIFACQVILLYTIFLCTRDFANLNSIIYNLKKFSQGRIAMTRRRFIYALLLAMFISGFLSSVTFIAIESNHECSDDDCPVCLQINICMNTLKALTLISLIVLALLTAHDDSLRNISRLGIRFRHSDLISLKVKLSR